MAYCSFSSDAVMFEQTPLSNLFIQEYMLRAPGDYVKVYIYALMQCTYPATAESSPEKLALALQMTPETVKKAFIYWQRKGLVRDCGARYELVNVRSAMFDSRVALKTDALYEFGELSNELSKIKGHTFTRSELELLFDLKEVDRFEDEAIVLLAAHCADTYKKKLSLMRLEAVAREWKTKGITTGEKAKGLLLGVELKNSDANKLLTAIGILARNVTVSEYNLYKKWTQEWGFTYEGISDILTTLSNVRNPNFKYLDKVLESARTGEKRDEESDKKVRQCAYKLGVLGIITDEQRIYYTTWTTQYKLSDELILAACSEASAASNGSFKGVDALLSQYARQGIDTPAAVKADRDLDRDCARIFQSAGIKRAPNLSEKTVLKGFLESMPLEVVLQGAEYAADANKPIAYLTRLIIDWKRDGVKTVKAARTDHEKRVKATPRDTVHFALERTENDDTLSSLVDDMGWSAK